MPKMAPPDSPEESESLEGTGAIPPVLKRLYIFYITIYYYIFKFNILTYNFVPEVYLSRLHQAFLVYTWYK